MTTVDIDVSKILAGKQLGKNIVKSKQFIGNQVITLADPLVPFREGYLKNSATIATDGSYIMYNTPYARRWYYEEANFRGAPARGTKWVERAVNSNETQLKQAYVNFINRGGGQ